MLKKITGLFSTAVGPLVSKGFQGARFSVMGVLVVALLAVLIFSSHMSTYFAVQNMKGDYYRAYTCEVEEIVDVLKTRGPSVMFLEDCPLNFASAMQKGPVNFLGLKLPAMGPFLRAEYKLLKTSEDRKGFLQSKTVSSRRIVYSIAALNKAAAEGREPTMREVWGSPLDVGPFMLSASIVHKMYGFSNFGKSEVVLTPNTETALRESPFFGLNATAVRFLPQQKGYDGGAQLFLKLRDDAKGIKNNPKLKLDDKVIALRLAGINLGLMPTQTRYHTVFGLFYLDEETNRPVLVPYVSASRKNLKKAALKAEDNFYKKFDAHPLTGKGAPDIEHAGTVVFSAAVAPGVPSSNHYWMMKWGPMVKMAIPLSCIIGGWLLIVMLNVKAYLAAKEKGGDRSGLPALQKFMPELMVAGEIFGSAILLWLIFQAGRGGVGAFIISLITLAVAGGLYFAPVNKWPEAEGDEKEALVNKADK